MKRKLTKALALLLALAMVLSLGACGSTGTDSVPTAETSSVQSEEVSEPAAEPEAEATPEAEPEAEMEPAEEPVPDEEVEVPEVEVPEEEPEPEVQEVNIVAAENEYCSFSITEIDPTDGYKWTVALENKTDQNLMFLLTYGYAINGITCQSIGISNLDRITVPAGTTSTETFDWVNYVRYDPVDLDEYGFGDITKVTFHLAVKDADGGVAFSPADFLFYDTVTVYPLGEDTVELYERAPEADDVVLVDNEYCTIAVIGVDSENEYGERCYGMELYVENKTDSWLNLSKLSSRNDSGNYLQPGGGVSIEVIAPASVRYGNIYWTWSDLEEYGISEGDSFDVNITATGWTTVESSTKIFDGSFTVTP